MFDTTRLGAVVPEQVDSTRSVAVAVEEDVVVTVTGLDRDGREQEAGYHWITESHGIRRHWQGGELFSPNPTEPTSA
jgi:hypothetical protein